MIRSILLLGLTALCFQAESQIDSLVHSGKRIAKGTQLYDSGNYDLSIQEFRRIDPRDTNYVYSLTRLAKSYQESKKFEEALAVCEAGLSERSSYRAELLNLKAKALAGKGDYEKAYAVLTSGMEEFPFDAALTFRFGAILYGQNKFDEAEEKFFKTVDLSPYFSGAHLYLSKIAMLRGHKVQGMLSMGIYLAINNGENQQLVILENFAKNELSDENTIPQGNSPNAFERLDEIIRAKIVFESEYTTKIPVDLGVVRQYQLLFDQIKDQEFPAGDPWVKYYVTMYKDIAKSQMQEFFVYHILESAPVKQVAQWKEKNKKSLQTFYNVVNGTLSQYRKIRTLPEKLGYKSAVQCRYYDNSYIESIGDKDQNEKQTGKWIYFDENGVKLAEGFYTAGKKTGIWNYFNNLGIPTDMVNYDTGERKNMDADGFIHQHYFNKNDKMEGTFDLFYPCSALLESRGYHEGKREGPGKTFYPNGKPAAEFSFKNDSLQGRFLSWFENGAKKTDQTFDRGQNQGRYTAYFADGRMMTDGTYEHGKGEGIWSYYSSNGNLRRKGNYKNDFQFGPWEYFNRRGELVERKSFNEKGEIHGEQIYFHRDKVFSKAQWKNNILTALAYYDKSGKTISSVENPDGTFKGKAYFPTSELQVEFEYVKGLRSGLWTYYFRSGKITSENPYKDGKLNGVYREYYPSGQLKLQSDYVDGNREGKHLEYHENGVLKLSGWFSKDKKQQKWLTFNPNATLSSDSYYLNDELTGYIMNYGDNGKPLSKVEYNRQGKIKGLIRYKEDGTVNSSATENKDHLVISQKYASGQLLSRDELACGAWEGESVNFLSTGKLYRSRLVENGKYYGKYYTALPEGNVEGTGHYLDDRASGTWTWYRSDGGKYSEGMYFEGDRDSVWTYYYQSGQVSGTTAYLDDLRDGEAQVFGLDGQLILSKDFQDNDIVSYRAKGKDGKLSDWIPFSGTGKIEAYYSNGMPGLEEVFKNNEIDGDKKIYYPNGKLYSHYRFKSGLFQGVCEEYYADGKVRERRLYKDDHPSGIWEYYDQNGNLTRKETYVAGNLSGMTEFFKNGKKTGEQKFRGDTPSE